MEKFAPEMCYRPLLGKFRPSLAFDEKNDYGAWRGRVRRRLRMLIGDLPHKTELNIRIRYTKKHERFSETRFIFSAETNADVPCHLLVPNGGGGRFTTMQACRR